MKDKKSPMSFISNCTVDIQNTITSYNLDFLFVVNLEARGQDNYILELIVYDKFGKPFKKNLKSFYKELTPSFLAEIYSSTLDLNQALIRKYYPAVNINPVNHETNRVNDTNSKLEQSTDFVHEQTNKTHYPVREQGLKEVSLTGGIHNFILYNELGIKTNNDVTQSFFLTPGINILEVYPKEMFHDCQVVVIHSSNTNNDYINVSQFHHTKMLNLFGNCNVYFLHSFDSMYTLTEIQIGGRFPLDEFSKVKLAFSMMNSSSAGIEMGYEHSLFDFDNSFDYIFSWYSDLNLNVFGIFNNSYIIGLTGGINIRILPVLLSGNIGISLNYINNYNVQNIYVGLVFGFDIGWFPWPEYSKNVEYR